MTISAIIIDNEPKSVFTLQSFLHVHCPQVVVTGTAHNAKIGKELIKTLNPQLVFLDIEMPMASGFDMLNSFEQINFEIIFVTAYNQYAINAFHFSAVDYLLKPVRITVLKDAVSKVEKRISEKLSERNYLLLLRNMSEQQDAKKKLTLTDKGEQYLVELGDIMYLEGSSNYTHIHTKNRTFLSTKRLKE